MIVDVWVHYQVIQACHTLVLETSLHAQPSPECACLLNWVFVQGLTENQADMNQPSEIIMRQSVSENKMSISYVLKKSTPLSININIFNCKTCGRAFSSQGNMN